MRIYLVGFMGCGKTTLGRALAECLRFQFHDLDRVLEASEGMPIPDIFEKKGQAYFREREAECLRQTAHLDKAIIATGGGAPCFLENMDWMNTSGVTLYLKVPVPLLAQRLEADPSPRPVLGGRNGADLEIFIEQLLAEREIFYRQSQLCCEIFLEEDGLAEELASYFGRFVKS